MNIFRRPAKAPATGVQQPSLPYPRKTGGPAGSGQPWPRIDATFAAFVGMILTAFAMVSGADRHPSQLAHVTAVGMGITLLVSFAFEARGGIKNLVRADILGMVALYYLTLYEFLFPQPYFDVNMRDLQSAYLALWAVLVGFAGLFTGRHLLPRGRQPFERIMTGPVHPAWLVVIFWGSLFLGFFHMLVAVEWDFAKLIDEMTKVRFDRLWARKKFGTWKTLLNELALLLYLIPPIAGLMLARRHRYALLNTLTVLVGFGFVLFYGFTDGTRTVFGAHLVTFMIAFAFASSASRRREVIVVCAACAVAMALSTKAMLDMRTIGFQRWWNGEKASIVNRYNSSVFVDDNLLAIAKITQYFPSQNRGEYLGLEIPYLALVRPIPRAIWPGKPQGVSVSIEKAFGATQMTVAATFVGEAYMSGGLFGVVLEALVLGLMAAWWNRLASPRNSELGILIYSSGFFAVTITMRSTFVLTTALLPSIAGLVFGRFLLPKIRARLRPRPVVPPGLRNRRPETPPTGPPGS